MDLKKVRTHPLMKFVLFIFLIGLFIFLGKVFDFNQEEMLSFFKQFPLFLGAGLYILLYVFITFFAWFGPKDIFRIIAAFLFGPFLSSLLVYVAELINTIVLFSFSRKLGRDFVASQVRGAMKRIDEIIANTSYLSIFFVKFAPIVPMRFCDVGFGLTKISLKKYFTLSVFALPLRIYFVQLFLSLGLETVRNPDKLAMYFQDHPRIFLFSFVYVVGSLVAVFVMKKLDKKKAQK